MLSASTRQHHTLYPEDSARRLTAKELTKTLAEIAKQRGVKADELFVSEVDVGSTRVDIETWVE